MVQPNHIPQKTSQNYEYDLFNELKNKKPESSKGIYLKKIFINTTMGPGLQVDPSSAM